MKLPVALSVPPISLRAGFLGDRHGFARHHGFIDCRTAFDQRAIDGHLFARPHAQLVAHDNDIDGDIFFRAIGIDPPRRLGRKAKKRLDRARGLLPGAQFQHLAKQHQHGDDGCGFEVDRDRAIGCAEGRREDLRKQGRDDAVDPGDASAHGDQREHVEIAGLQRLPAAHEERPSRPQHHGRGERELEPVRELLAKQHVKAGQMAAHFERKDGNGERQPDPEPPRHVDQFVIGSALRRRHQRLQRHAANGAGAWSDLTDLRMHRAGVDGIFGLSIRSGPDHSGSRYFAGLAVNLVRHPAEQK